MLADPVRAIRVASTLVARFRVLIGTDMMNTSELELAIGEAQQIYPEIWRHLDEAYAALLARGRVVPEFEELRRGELGHLGVTEIDSAKHLDYAALLAGNLRIEEFKHARFNVAGYQSARAACSVLVDAMPEVDWAALERAEDRAIAAAGSLHGAKWLGIAKLIVMAAALVVVVVMAHRLLTRGEDAPSAPSAGRVTRAEREAAEQAALRQRADARTARLVELRRIYDTTCDRAVIPELVALLREDAQNSVATKLESSPCIPARPSCEEVRDGIADRLARQLELARDDRWRMECRGILVEREGKLTPRLAVVLTGRGPTGEVVSMRGLTSTDGGRDEVAFVRSEPGSLLAGLADLDGDASEDLVLVSSRTLVVAVVKPDGFRDIEGPVLRQGCRADVNVEGDFRAGRDGSRKALVLTVPDGRPRAGCPPPGRHYFAIVDGKLEQVD